MIYGYLRVSTDIQDLDNQKQSLLNYEQSNGIKIDRYIEDDGISGTTDYEERNLGKLIGRCKKGDTIIAAEISRLGRSLFMVMRFLETCMKKELRIITIKDGYTLTDSIQSKVLAFAFGLAAEIEREMFLKRSAEAQKRFVDNGGCLRAVSRPPRYKLAKFDKEVRKLCKEGKSLAAIGRCFGVSRDSVERYITVFDIPHKCTTHHRDFSERNAQSHKAAEVSLAECRGAIEYGIEQGFTYGQIYQHVKKCKPHIKIAEKTIRYYIQREKNLIERWCAMRNNKRLEANIKATWKATKRLQYERELEAINKELSQ